MKTKAAVLERIGAPLRIIELELPLLERGQVLVRIKAAGICHSQISEIDGERGEDKYLPHLLGHEAAGIVEETGGGVKKVKPGDQVVLTWIKGKGLSPGGIKFASKDGDVNAGAIAVFSDFAIVNENRAVPFKEKIDWGVAALFGCAVPTGVGAVLNTLKVKRGSTVAVFGVGGVGLCSIMAAKLAGAKEIIAVDVLPGKLKAGLKAGATAVLDAKGKDVIGAARNKYPEGVDYAIAAVGVPKVIEQAFEIINDRGKVAVVGHPPTGQTINIEPHALIRGKQILGSWGGGVRPDNDIRDYIRWYMEGKLPVDMLISKKYPLGRINGAVSDLRRGRTIRPILVF